MNAAEFAAKVRRRETVVGYWIQLDSPASTERVARLGYDYVSLDAQHGLFGYSGMLAALTAIDAAGRAVGLVRVAANDATADRPSPRRRRGRGHRTAGQHGGGCCGSGRGQPLPTDRDPVLRSDAVVDAHRPDSGRGQRRRRGAGDDRDRRRAGQRRRHRRHARARRPLHRTLRPHHRRRRRRARRTRRWPTRSRRRWCGCGGPARRTGWPPACTRGPGRRPRSGSRRASRSSRWPATSPISRPRPPRTSPPSTGSAVDALGAGRQVRARRARPRNRSTSWRAIR